MKELLIRAVSGLFYTALLLLSLQWQQALTVLLLVFGLIVLAEFNRLIGMKSWIPFLIFILLYAIFCYWQTIFPSNEGFKEAVQILHVLTIFVLLILIKDLFSDKPLPSFITGRYINSTFYISSAFIFMIQIANFGNSYKPEILLGAFILVWTNDSFAYLVGRALGKQKLFPRISPNKTVEGFLGGLFFSCIASYFIAKYSGSLSFNNWLIMAIIISVFGTLGDLVESKFKRQAGVKDSGIIMPGHGGLLDRLDSIIFATPFIYLFLRFI